MSAAAPPSGPPGPVVDWEDLRDRAIAVAALAHAPYSRLRVGAAAVTTSGAIVVGCNVENASYGLTLCAECGLVSALRAGGHVEDRLVAFACRSASGDLLLPCGRCRQLLQEFGGSALLVDAPQGPRPLGDLLPFAFGPEQLP